MPNMHYGFFRCCFYLVVTAACLCISKPLCTQAQDAELDPQLYAPPASTGLTLTIPRPEVLHHLDLSIGLSTTVAGPSLTRSSDGEDLITLYNQSELLLALGLFEWIEFGLAVPLVVANSTRDASSDPIDHDLLVRPGDPRLSMKVPILRGDFALSGRLLVTLPILHGRYFTGAGYWTTTPSVLLAYDFGVLRLGSELGYRMRRRALVLDLEYDDELHMALGASVPLGDHFEILAEAQVRVGVAGRTIDSDEIPWEIDAGARWYAKPNITLEVGAGTSFSDAYGTPEWRASLAFRYVHEAESCTLGPEDFDGFEDGDFCADPDNDGDGINDVDDLCPNDAEDRDNFADGDGCPDADGILDKDDECPMAAEDADGHNDRDGCPETDNDSDGVPDVVDLCVMEPEDIDGYQDEDGCPEPGPEKATITVTDTRILISERIYFDFDQDTIRQVSLPLLTRVAEVMKNLPEQKHIRVEGYTDSMGDPDYNRDLSYRRARSVVEYLAIKEVPRERLHYVGYGSKNLVAPDDTPTGRALNRRVEFTIINAPDAPEKQQQRRRRRRRRKR